MTSCRIFDHSGRQLFDVEFGSLLHEEMTAKQYIGSVDDVFYFMLGSWGWDDHYNYLVSFDGKTGEAKLVWENLGQGSVADQ